MAKRCNKAGCARALGILSAFVAVPALLSACSESRDDWYDKTAAASEERTEKIESLKAQGFGAAAAAKEVDYQASIKATERGEGVPPLEGADLSRAIQHTQ